MEEAQASLSTSGISLGASKVVVGSRVVCVCCQKCGRRGVLCSPRHAWQTKLHASVSYAHRSISVSFSELRNIASHSYRADEHRLGTDSLAIHPYPPQSLGSHLMPWPPMSCLDQFWLHHPSTSYLLPCSVFFLVFRHLLWVFGTD